MMRERITTRQSSSLAIALNAVVKNAIDELNRMCDMSGLLIA